MPAKFLCNLPKNPASHLTHKLCAVLPKISEKGLIAMPTPHNAANKGDIAKTVLMPGDPLRAKFIAENFLDNAVCYNTVRGMFGYTGTYHGVPVSVQGSGMGMPSIGIYSYELFHEYDVDRILRIGTAGGVADHVQLRDVILGQAACTDSNYAAQYALPGTYAPIASFSLLEKAYQTAKRLDIPVQVGNLFSTDVFYREPSPLPQWAKTVSYTHLTLPTT
mgnify:FL=1